MIPEEQFKIIQNLNQSYYQDNKTIIYHGDNRIDLKKIPDESIDLIVTDPNYGIKFMGKKWDVDVPAVETWIECLRVLKPGAFAYIMSSPRQDVLSEMIVRIRQAGFDTNFSSLYHVYAQGMPKAMNMSRAVDKKLGFERKVIGQRQDILQKQAKDFERGYRKIKDSFDAGAPERNNGFITISADITAPESPEAKALDGAYTFNPKPALEVIIVAMRPLSEKTFVEQALFNGKGISWLDDCRIPLEEDSRLEKGGTYSERNCNNDTGMFGKGNNNVWTPRAGRFPANLLVSSDALNDGREHKSGDLTGQYGTENKVYGVYDKSRPQYLKGNSVDSFSRYFDLDKWFEENLKKLPKEVQQTFPFLIVPKASKSERNEGCDETEPVYTDDSRHDKNAIGCNNPRNRSGTPKINFHPTCKPIKLMSYLITLGSREGDIVLDPHAGSGTTCIAARMLNRFSIGIDMEESYLRDITVPKLKEMAKQKSILDFGSD